MAKRLRTSFPVESDGVKSLFQAYQQNDDEGDVAINEAEQTELEEILQAVVNENYPGESLQAIYSQSVLRHRHEPWYFVVCGEALQTQQRVARCMTDVVGIVPKGTVLLKQSDLKTQSGAKAKDYILMNKHHLIICQGDVNGDQVKDLRKVKERGYNIAVLFVSKGVSVDHSSEMFKLSNERQNSALNNSFCVDIVAGILVDIEDEKSIPKITRVINNISTDAEINWYRAMGKAAQLEHRFLEKFVNKSNFTEDFKWQVFEGQQLDKTQSTSESNASQRKTVKNVIAVTSFDSGVEFDKPKLCCQEDIQAIQEAISGYEDQFEIRHVNDDLTDSISRVDPLIWYISCHGYLDGDETFLTLKNGSTTAAKILDFAKTASVGSGKKLQIVFLNCCNGQYLAEELRQICGIDHVVYWEGPCLDSVCPKISKSFFYNFAMKWIDSNDYSLQHCVTEALDRAKQNLLEECYENPGLPGISLQGCKKWAFGSRRREDLIIMRVNGVATGVLVPDPDLEQQDAILRSFENRYENFLKQPVGEIRLISVKSLPVPGLCRSVIKTEDGDVITEIESAPIVELSLKGNTAASALISLDAKYYTYCHHPRQEVRAMFDKRYGVNKKDLLDNFFKHGGFLYLDAEKKPLHFNVLSNAPVENVKYGRLYFSNGQRARHDVISTLEAHKRFIKEDGVDEYTMCWMTPSENIVPAPAASRPEHGAFMIVDKFGEGTVFAVRPEL